jgi:UDP-N-acetylmuramate: L-alanyl-gamma-D-glutamyl-meso-diaminopimelate ligase
MPYDYCSMILREGAHIHLIAACGTAMGSLAAMLCELGYRVTGSDSQVYPPMSTFLAQAGIHLFTGFDSTHLDEQPDLVIVGNAVSRGNVELEATLERRIPYSCLPEVLRDLFIRDRQSVVITGTHGKTTTTAMTAHLFTSGDLDPSFLVAGLVKNFDRPYRLGHGKHFIIEGDEYDSAYFAKWAKFFFYLPEVLIINNIEFDHADIYKDLSEIEKAFRQVVNMVPCSGLILANSADEVVTNLLPLSLAPVQTFGLEQHSFWRADIISSTPAGTGFTLHCQDRPLGNFHLSMHGATQRPPWPLAIGRGCPLIPCAQVWLSSKVSAAARNSLDKSTIFYSSTILPIIQQQSAKRYRRLLKHIQSGDCGLYLNRPVRPMRGPFLRNITSQPLPRRHI